MTKQSIVIFQRVLSFTRHILKYESFHHSTLPWLSNLVEMKVHHITRGDRSDEDTRDVLREKKGTGNKEWK